MPIPNIPWPPTPPGGGVVPARTEINAAAESSTAQTRNATVLAAGQRIPLIYGETTIGARADIWLVHNNYLLMRCLVGHGPIAAVVSVSSEGDALPAGVEYTTYLGFPGQGIDPWLAAAFAAQAPASPYVDTLPGIAYAVFRVPVGALAGLPQFRLLVRGRLLYDPRTGTIAYTDNAALALADALASATYGANLTVDWDSATTVADRCDDLVGPSGTQEKRRIIGLAITERVRARDLFSALRFYAGCWIDRSGPAVRLVADAPAAPVMTFDAGHIVSGSMRTRRGSILDAVSEVRATYTEPAKDWADEVAVWEDPGIALGTVERMTATLKTPGINRHSQAVRECLERRNKLMLCDFEARWTAFDIALKVRKYDVVDVQVDAVTLKRMRVMDMVPKSPGRWDMLASEYDPAVWSDSVATAPTYPDSAYPSPMVLPAVTGLVLGEEVFQMLDGSWSSRIVATWTAPTWAYLAGYRVEIYDAGSNLLAAAPVTGPLWRSGAVEEAQLYTVRVAAVSTLAVGAWASATKTPLGKALLPSNVPSLTGFEVGGEVRLTIGASTDLDMTGYEVRYGPVACSWALSSTVKFVNFINAASGVGGYCIYKDAPAGTWDFLVCARDSIGQYSPTPARITITVTLDVNSFLVDNHDFSAGTPTLTGMAEYSLPCDPARYFVTEDSVAFGTKFATALSGFTNPLATYHASGTSEFLTNAYDFGQSLAGNWSGTLSSVAMSGTKSDVLRLSPDGSTYADESGMTARTVARFGKLKSSASGTSTLLITMPEAKLRIDAIPRVENGTITTSASTYVTVTLAAAYASVKSIPLTPIGSAPIHAVADAITVGATTSFNIYAFNSVSGAQVAAPVMWEFQGV